MCASPKKPLKLNDPLNVARRCLKSGKYTVTYHAKIRQIERIVPLPDVIHTIENGWHEKKKDRYDEKFKAWNYSVRGKSTDQRELRVIISFDEGTELLIVTVIELKLEE